jgi:gliding motility-associated-like protein
MIKKILLSVLLFLATTQLFATHIVGYDMAMIHVSGNNYKFRLNFFRDFKNGLVDNATTGFRICAKSNPGVAVKSVTLSMVGTPKQVEYKPEDCAPPGLVAYVEKRVYEVTTDLSMCTDPGGYYIFATDGARNSGIQNLPGGGNQSIEYVMEFPAVALPQYAGHNSPGFNKDPLTFFCVGRPYNIDWQLIDPTPGDYYVCSNTLPLDQAGAGYPYNPIPYASVNGYNVNYNIMDGVPDVNINSTNGMISFLPTKIGNYQLAFLVEEYGSNGVKKGEIRREIQVTTALCPTAPPITTNREKEGGRITTTASGHAGSASATASRDGGEVNTIIDTIYVNEGIRKCIQFTSLDDPNDSLVMTVYADPSENVFDPNLYGATFGAIGHTSNKFILQGVGSVQGEFCWKPDCKLAREEPYQFTLITRDNSCPVPFYDTSLVKIFVRAYENLSPEWVSPVSFDGATLQYFMNAGETLVFDTDSMIKVTDPNDPIRTSQNVDIRFVNMELEPKLNNAQLNNNPGVLQATGTFEWKTQCEWARFDPYRLKFIAFDNDCAAPDTIAFYVEVFLLETPNWVPDYDTSVTKEEYHVKLGETLTFTVRATDSLPYAENRYNNITLNFDKSSFDAVASGVSPVIANATGAPNVSSVFSWTPNCDNVRPEPYELTCTIYDDACVRHERPKKIYIYVDGPINDAPHFIHTPPAVPHVLDTTIEAGKIFTYTVSAKDTNAVYKSVKIDVVSEILSGAVLPVATTSPIVYEVDSNEVTLTWATVCDNIRSTPYQIRFYAMDDACPQPSVDTFTVNLTVVEKPNDVPEFNPAITDVTKTSFEVMPGETLSILLASIDLQAADGVVIDTVFTSIPKSFRNQPLFQRDSSTGGANTSFDWLIDCEHISSTPYVIKFATYDDACRQYRDSTTYTITVKVVPNPALNPMFSSQIDTAYEVVAGEKFILELVSENIVGDSILIVSSGDPYGFIPGQPASFTQNTVGTVSTASFVWETSCEQINTVPYKVQFRTYNPVCHSDTQVVNVLMKVVPNTDVTEVIPNAFSPNGDGYNDTYMINKSYKVYCDPEFTFLIFNRWGKKVFESKDPDFVWTGDGLPSGTYFYTLSSRARKETGTINLIK